MRPKALTGFERRRIAALLRGLRVQAGLGQTEMAKLLRKPQSFVSRYEAAERRLDLVEIHDICDALGVPLRDFVEKFEHRE